MIVYQSKWENDYEDKIQLLLSTGPAGPEVDPGPGVWHPCRNIFLGWNTIVVTTSYHLVIIVNADLCFK